MSQYSILHTCAGVRAYKRRPDHHWVETQSKDYEKQSLVILENP
jgi:hypothetical protein